MEEGLDLRPAPAEVEYEAKVCLPSPNLTASKCKFSYSRKLDCSLLLQKFCFTLVSLILQEKPLPCRLQQPCRFTTQSGRSASQLYD